VKPPPEKVSPREPASLREPEKDDWLSSNPPRAWPLRPL